MSTNEYNERSASFQHDDDRHTNLADNLIPPNWFEERYQQEPPPVVDDGFEREWLDTLSDDGSPPKYFCSDLVELEPAGGDWPPIMVLWQGRQWCLAVRGVTRRDGSCLIPIDKLWNDNAIRHAIATDQCDFDDLKEALRLARRIDAFFQPVGGML
jgi:hypothetical protein